MNTELVMLSLNSTSGVMAGPRTHRCAVTSIADIINDVISGLVINTIVQSIYTVK